MYDAIIEYVFWTIVVLGVFGLIFFTYVHDKKAMEDMAKRLADENSVLYRNDKDY